ncbi:MAG: PEP-CTERM sorting domain-containing protein [Pirellulales bacterium]
MPSQDWPTVNNQSSIWLNNLSGDPNLGTYWTRAGAAGDTLSGQASPIYQNAVDHPGGDIGSPGYTPGVPPANLTGDYNNDGKVDAADYVVWRKTGVNGQQGYNDWRANFGAMMGTGSSFGDGEAVPEPASLALLLIGCSVLCRHRQSA